MRLFAHIKANGIAMTAPVEQTLESDGSGRTSMAFLYARPGMGEAGEAKNGVRVVDLPAQTVLSIGFRGADSSDVAAEAVSQLRERAAELGGYEQAGPPRLLGYNSPFVPRSQRYFEVQIPLRPLSVTEAVR